MVLCGLIFGAAAVFLYCTFWAPTVPVPNPPMVDKSRQAKLLNMRDDEDRRIKVIPEDPENMCVAWREVDGCIADGTRQAFKDANCRDDIMPWQTGWCECKDAAAISFQVPFDCRSVDQSKRKTSITCAKTCRDRILGGKEKFERLSRAHQASTQRADTLIEIENRRKEDAARWRQEEEEKQKQAAVVRGMIQKGDDLLADIFGKIEEKDFAASERMLGEARDWYERAGVVDVSKPDGSTWELHELYRKPEASPKELAISGVADKLIQAKQMEREQAESAERCRFEGTLNSLCELQLEAMEQERQRQEAAIRYAAGEIDRRQREQLEELRRRHDERMRELARQAQEEALLLMRNKKAIEEEDRVRRSMTAEQLAEREKQLHAKWVMEERARNGSHDDPEALEAQRKYAEFLASKRRETEGAPTLAPAGGDDAQEASSSPASTADAATAKGGASRDNAADGVDLVIDAVAATPAGADAAAAAAAIAPAAETAPVAEELALAALEEKVDEEPAAPAAPVDTAADAAVTVREDAKSVTAKAAAVASGAFEGKEEQVVAVAAAAVAVAVAAETPAVAEAVKEPSAKTAGNKALVAAAVEEAPLTQTAAEAAPTAEEELAVPATETVPRSRPPTSEGAPASEKSKAVPAAVAGSATASAPAQQQQGAGGSDLGTELFAAGLSAHESALREIGVESVGDLRYLDEGIIELLPLQQTHKRSLRQLVNKFASL